MWDYRAWQCQLVSSQPEGPLGVALHPDGMQLLLAFKEKLRAYHIGISTLLPWREFDLAARQVCYSSHGHYFAVAVERSVLLFDACPHATPTLTPTPTPTPTPKPGATLRRLLTRAAGRAALTLTLT